MNKTLTNKGFTIIEVVLVLAIAGLIFLMVFVALPALNAGQRDTARKNDASTILAAVNTYISGNRGAFPTQVQLTGTTGVTGTNGETGSVPGAFVKEVSSNTTHIQVAPAGSTSVSVRKGEAIVTQSTTCGSTGVLTNGEAPQTLVAGSKNQYTVTTFLEGGGGVSYCAQS